jgi:hypothetical protein
MYNRKSVSNKKRCTCSRNCWCRKTHNKTKTVYSSKTKKSHKKRRTGKKSFKGGNNHMDVVNGASPAGGIAAYQASSTFMGAPYTTPGGAEIQVMPFKPMV